MDAHGKKPARRRPRLGAVTTVLLMLALLGASLLANAWKQDLAVREVRAYGTKILAAGEVVGLAGVGKNQRLFAVDLGAVRRRVEANPYVRSAVVMRDLPGRISVQVTERSPVAVLLAERRLYIDDSACVLPESGSAHLLDLPFLTGALPECVPGRTVRAPAVREALALLTAARAVGTDLYHGISEVRIGADGSLLCYTAEAGVPVLFGQGRLAEKLVKFDSFWKEYVARRGARDLEYVDLRFEDQIVVRWNQRAELALHEGTLP